MINRFPWVFWNLKRRQRRSNQVTVNGCRRSFFLFIFVPFFPWGCQFRICWMSIPSCRPSFSLHPSPTRMIHFNLLFQFTFWINNEEGLDGQNKWLTRHLRIWTNLQLILLQRHSPWNKIFWTEYTFKTIMKWAYNIWGLKSVLETNKRVAMKQLLQLLQLSHYNIFVCVFGFTVTFYSTSNDYSSPRREDAIQ